MEEIIGTLTFLYRFSHIPFNTVTLTDSKGSVDMRNFLRYNNPNHMIDIFVMLSLTVA